MNKEISGNFGNYIKKNICEKYGLMVHQTALEQFVNVEGKGEVQCIIDKLFNLIGHSPVKLLAYTKEYVDDNLVMSPYDFLLDNGETLTIKTFKTSNKVAPRILGQAGYNILNSYFSQIYGKQINAQEDIKELIETKIDKILSYFIDKLFEADYTAFINMNNDNINLIRRSDIKSIEFCRDDFTFTRRGKEWCESTTLKYRGVSIAEIQVHKKRTFKFRFFIDNIKEII